MLKNAQGGRWFGMSQPVGETVGASLLAMDVNDNACCLNERVVQGFSRAGSLLQGSGLHCGHRSIGKYFCDICVYLPDSCNCVSA
ncbi:hypothetical protein CES87_19570 [Pseudomonas sp. ERMR1:02]|nr:hypothetical protein CES87_19570 [Pseudomonas sp. ERMR1:02]